MKSIHFPLALREKQESEPLNHRPKPAIVVLWRLRRDHALIGQQLKSLGRDEMSYHGRLQVILSALRRMESDVEMLTQEEVLK